MGIRLRTSLRQLIEERGLNAGLDEAQISELLAPYEGLLGAEDLTRLTRQLLASDPTIFQFCFLLFIYKTLSFI